MPDEDKNFQLVALKFWILENDDVTCKPRIDLESWFKIYTNISNVETASPKPYELLNFFYQFCDNCRIPSFSYHMKEAEMKIMCVCSFLRVSQKS